MTQPTISIIVPVYNSEKYLGACIDSILSQSFRDFELILVDDGSRDSSPHICDDYAQKDRRVKVIHKENGGVSSARNAGLSAVGGGYLCFLDSDDTLEPSALQLMYQSISNENVDLVIAGYNRYDEDGTKIFGMSNSAVDLISHEAALEEMYTPRSGNYQGYLWNKLFRKSIVEQAKLAFDESISFNEDRLFITQYLCASSRDVAYTTTPVYNYVVRSTGAMGSLENSYNPKFSTDFDAYVRMKNAVFAYTKDKRLRQLAVKGICHSYINNHKLMVKHDGYDSSIHSRLFKGVIRHNAFGAYVSIMLRPVLINFLLLVYPKLLVKIKRRHPGDAT